MSKPKLDKTYSSFSRNTDLNRANETRRDNDTIKTQKVTIYDIDYAIIDWMRSVVQPQIIENGKMIDVPIMYANGESWAQIQSKGFMYDKKGKIMTPLMTLRRSNITERDTLKALTVNQNPKGNNLLLKNPFNIANRYDRFSATYGKRRVEEYYVSVLPEFIDVTYEMLIWTEYQEQMNSLIEKMIPMSGMAWGTTWKFSTMVQDVTTETITATGEDRLVRATVPLMVKGHLLGESEFRRSNMERRIAVKKIKFNEHVDDNPNNITNYPDDEINLR